ncbi:Sucrose phosphorylase [Streptococcus sp. DD11]|nr:Sucrose phosphorylase [Streptococcus sp. DD11]
MYYVGFLAGKNDLELLEETKEGRNINRHYYSNEEIAQEVKRPVVQALIKLFSYRNQSAAFDLDGSIDVELLNEHSLHIVRSNADKSVSAEVVIHLKDLTYTASENGQLMAFE